MAHKKVLKALHALGRKKKRKAKNLLPKIKKHLHGDIRGFHNEALEDKELLKDIDAHYKSRPKEHKDPKKKSSKFEKVMHEFKEDTLHSGSKRGPKVKNKKQALAIAFNESKRLKKKK